MVVVLRAGCRAALFLWIFSNISCRARTALPSSQKCDEPLVSGLAASSFSSSSSMPSASNSYAPGFAKLNKRGGAGGWCPSDSDHYQWLQVDFGNRKQISSIATQGRYSSSDWVTQYRMLYSDTGRNWKPYHQDGNVWAFPGNINSDSVVRHDLQHPVIARYVRLLPLDWSGEGQIGLRIEIYGCPYWADVINFDGHVVLPYRFGHKKKTLKTLKDVIALKFKTSESEGVIFHGEGQQGDYITLELKKAKLVLNLNLGSNQYGSIYGHTSVTTGSLLDDHHWHSVVIERHGRNINLTLDRHLQHFRINGEFDYLDLDYEITFGGMPFSGKPSSSSRKNFKGCMESIIYNTNNITDMARRKKLEPSNVGNLSFSCVEPHTVPVFFNATSFLEVPGRPNQDVFSVNFQFRTWNPNGLLLFSNFAEGLGTIEIDLIEGKVSVHINVTGVRKSQIDISSGAGLNDGQWHEVRFLAKENFAVLTIDGDEASSVRSNSPLKVLTGEKYLFGGFLQLSFQGCMQLIHVDDQLVDLHAVEQGKLGSFANVSIDMCAIIDRCVPNHCEHGGKCTQTWDSFSCNCDATRYSGATCHNSNYELSCEAYKHLGKPTGFYWIDPDGSGALGPLKVHCNMTEDKVWTTVNHDLQEHSPVVSKRPEKHALLQLNYSATMDQISAITSSAEYCEQFISYTCKMSRLLNTPEGSPYTWWFGRANEKHYYWGGSGPGIQKCACGIERNCTDSKYHCNCDADSKKERKDAGLLSYKDHLPVSQVMVGDIDRPGSEAKLTVGPLRCHGDQNYWNAASFITPSSYLHFSTFQGETSADISFYFKTSAADGVFLENLGNTDFIKLELKSATDVSFSFDVGNGPVEIMVRSPSPLNDDQWHWVTAERNVKEASLQVDQLPRETRKAPTEGHTRLELYSQLYVGAAGGQKGFLGCIRSLRMNGLTLDLEERAKVTPGVKPGCSGHCTSFGMYCKNGGKCVEKYNGYSCDCSGTAYDGPYCKKDVGAFFEEGMWLRYNFSSVGNNVKDLGSRTLLSSKETENAASDLNQEELSFSFSTNKAPCVLLYLSSYSQDYMAVLVNPSGSLQIRYNLGGTKEPYNINVDHRNVSNGQPHSVNITRQGRFISLQLDHYPAVTYTLPASSSLQFHSLKSLFLGKVIVFVNQDEASAVLHRYKRHNSGLLEEILQGNLERECIEEVCNYEEAREVFEDDMQTIIFWDKYAYGGEGCKSRPCMNGGTCHCQPNDYRCVCLDGYEGKNCEIDLTCSAKNGGCKQICENGPTGKAVCSCATGYRLMEDQKSCEPTVPFPCGRTGAPEAMSNQSSDATNVSRGSPVNKAQSALVEPTPPQEPISTNSKKGEVPWQVYILSYERKELCGGTIINEKWIATAAHCLEYGPHAVVAGEHNTDAFDHTEQQRRVVKAIRYPEYNATNRYHNDVALLELDSPLELNHYVTPICIADEKFTSNLLQHGSGMVSGWWKPVDQRRRANILQVLRVHRAGQATCQMDSGSTLLPNMFCAGLSDSAKKTYRGGSGGPYAIDVEGTWFLTAIASCWEQCGGKGNYDIYTGVADYIQWLRNTTKLA